MILLWLDSGKRKGWVCRVMGLDKTYGLDRDFLAPVDKRDGSRAYLLEEGPLYQVQPAEGDRSFLLVVDGKEEVLATEDAMKLVEGMEAEKKRGASQIDDALRRVNFDAEGGFSTN